MTTDREPVVESPTSGVDPRVALATALQSAPGVYAVLAGSGMSSAAGIPTGWQVIQDLIRKVALAEGVDPNDVANAPEAWWTSQGRPEPRYDTLVSALAPTDAARQSLLRTYFEKGTDSTDRSQPTNGHHELAALVARGLVRVIITTNFDRLIERALDQAGIQPQVISSVEALGGMTPLQFSSVTVIKLHGDYLSQGLRNTPQELSDYPAELDTILARILDEYGLIVVGWSAEYDTALIKALEASPSRRYPTYWTSFNGDLSENARRLIAQRQASVIDTAGADEFFSDVRQKVERLEQVAQRRGRPSVLRHYYFMPERSVPAQGWADMPLLQLRAAVAIGPASPDTCGFLRAENRDSLVEALQMSSLTSRLRDVAELPGALSNGNPSIEQSATVTALSEWEPTPGVQQSTQYASYRIGGDASRGVSAIAAVRFPGFGVNGQVLVTVDVGLSLEDKLRFSEVALILRDGLALLTFALPESLAGILPRDASAMIGEIHLVALNQYSSPLGGVMVNRENDVFEQVDLTLLGPTSGTNRETMGAATDLTGPLTHREAAELVCDEFDYILYASGFLDPRAGIEQLRRDLGLV